MFNIVLVDDEQKWLEIMHSMLKSTLTIETQLVSFTNPDEALDHIKKFKTDCVIADYLLPGYMTGLDLYYKLFTENKDLKFILISNSRIPPDKIKEIVQKDIVYLPKSFLVVKNFMKKHLEEILIAGD